MNVCDEKWTDPLMDVACEQAGAAVEASVARHAEECIACATVLETLRADQAHLDVALSAIVNREPSASFRAGVLREAEAKSSRSSGKGFWLAAAGVAAAAVLAILVAQPAWRASEPLPPAPELSAWRSPTDGLLRSASYDRLSDPPRLGRFYLELDESGDTTQENEHDEPNES